MTDLATSDTGSGRPLLWGHGLMMSRAEEDRRGPIRWSYETLPDMRLVRWDARGHGDSPPVDDSTQAQWDSLADDAIAVADHHDLDTFVLGGASMGAATALHVATMIPERIEALLLVIPPNAWERRVLSSVLYRGISAVSSLPIPLVGDQNRASVFHGAAHSDLPWPDDVKSIECPATILSWRFDPIHPVAVGEHLAELLPNATLHVNDRFGDTRGWVDVVRSVMDS